MKKNILLQVILLLIAQISFCQGVAINTTGAAADASAILDVSSTTNGLLVPRVILTATNIAAPVTTPATSLLVYNRATAGTGVTKVTPGYYFWNGFLWTRLTAANEGWTVTGNTGITTPAAPPTYGTSVLGANENWIGTTDANDIVLGTDNKERMRIKQTNGNVGIGTAAPFNKLQVEDSTTDNVIQALSNYVGNTDVRAVNGVSITNPGYGYGGFFTGGYVGVRGGSNATSYTGTSFGVVGAASGSAGTRVGGYFFATSGTSNYGVIVPIGGGRSGFGTSTPDKAHVQVEGVVGNTVGLFKGSATGKGISLISDWPNIFFNSYYNGGQRNMAATGYPGSIYLDQDNGYMMFCTTTVPNSIAGADGFNGAPNRMRIAGNGQVSIGQDNLGNIAPIADLTVLNPSTADADIDMFTVKHSGSAGTTWRMGSAEYYTEGFGNIGFSNNLSPIGANGSADLGSTANTKYGGYRWGTVYTTLGLNTSSDIRLKEKIQPVVYGINQLRKINPISYVMKNQSLGDGTKVPDEYKNVHIGFSAQELKKVIPEVVSSWGWVNNAEAGYIKALDPTLGVNYQEIIPITINELDAQQQKITKIINLSDFGTETINGNEITVTFSDDFKNKLQGNPIVTVTALHADAQFYISTVTNNGFTVKAKMPINGATFNWIAMAKIKESAVEINSNYTNAMHQKKLDDIAAFEAGLPTNAEAIKIVKATSAAAAKTASANTKNNTAEENRNIAMNKNAEAAALAMEQAAKAIDGKRDGKRD
jgi:hypothetical protein